MKLNYFPTERKNADVIFPQRPGRSGKYRQNYRAISLLSGLEKVVEGVILNRIEEEVVECHVIENHQFGFSRECGTKLQVCRENSAGLSAEGDDGSRSFAHGEGL